MSYTPEHSPRNLRTRFRALTSLLKKRAPKPTELAKQEDNFTSEGAPAPPTLPADSSS